MMVNRLRLGVAIGLVVSTAVLTARQPAATVAPSIASVMDKVDAYVRTELQQQKIPGTAIAIVKGSEIVAKGYGMANVEHSVAVTRQTIFQLGSVGKQFTSTAVMLQVEDGKLALDDSVTKYFTDAPSAWRPITVRHLLTHTSGVPNYSQKMIDYRREYTEDELAKIAYGLPLDFEPGSRWRYSNTGYILLGILVHKVSGKFYGDVLQERVFKPLGMKTARVISDQDIVMNRAAGYRLVNGQLKNQEWMSATMLTTADGSLYSSIDDFVAWDKGLRAGAVLSPKSWAQVYTPVKLSDGTAHPYGFGWAVEELLGKPRISHGGSWQGFKAHIARYLVDDLTIMALSNVASANPGRIVNGIATIIDPRLAKPESSSAVGHP